MATLEPVTTAANNQNVDVDYGPDTVTVVEDRVVGRRREVELVVAALRAGRHLLLEGPPGTGKSSMLRAIAETVHQPLEFVEGNTELTPSRLVGYFDPAQVLEQGYRPEIWIDGPLLRSLRDGCLLYLEELNRVPEETLNLLVTVMSERELTVPRLGRFEADPSFRIVAAMNPFDAIGTARLSGAIYDRMCRVAMSYQSAAEERGIAAAMVPHGVDGTHGPALIAAAVDLVRATRDHLEIRIGSSVRGAIDLLSVAVELSTLRGRELDDYDLGLDAATTAVSGRIRLHDSSTATAEDVIAELWSTIHPSHFDPAPNNGESTAGQSEDGATGGSGGKAPSRRAAEPTANNGY
jgi:MoxR-like ATPase